MVRVTRGLFHKTLQIRKLRIYNYGQILTVNLLTNCQNYVIYFNFVVNYEKKFYGRGPRCWNKNDPIFQMLPKIVLAVISLQVLLIKKAHKST